jgi:hypothetical protein
MLDSSYHMKSQPIDRIRKRFRREWLLFAVDRLDPRTQEPRSGRLLAHSPRRDDIYDRLVKAKGLTVAIYSEKTLPQGYAVAFRACPVRHRDITQGASNGG